MFFRVTVNAPINDDYNAVLGFINKYVSLGSFTDKIALLFSQHGEHRIVYDRLWIIISYKLQNNVDFNFLALIGNLSLLGIAIVFFKRFLTLKKHILLFVPVTVLIFNIASWENITFAMATLSNFTVHLFILLSLVFISSNTKNYNRNLYLSFTFLFFATMTQGGGLFLIPICLLILIYKKEYKNFSIFLILCASLLGLYFLDFNKPSHSAGLLSSILEYNESILRFAFAFLGNAFNYFLIYTNNRDSSLFFSTIVGFILFVLFLYITYTKYYKKNLFNYSLMLLLILSSFVTAISRISFGIETAGASRYRINGIIFFIAIYFWFIETRDFKKSYFIYLTLAFSTVYYFFINISHFQYLHYREKQTYVGILNYKSGKPEKLNGDRTLINTYKKLIEESKKLGTYNFPGTGELNRYFPLAETIIVNKNESKDSSLRISNNTETINKLFDSYFIEGWAFIKEINTKSQKVYIGIQSETDIKPIFYLATKVKRYDLTPYFKKPNLNDGGYVLRIHDSLIKSGENKIHVMVINNDKIKKLQTEKKIIKK